MSSQHPQSISPNAEGKTSSQKNNSKSLTLPSEIEAEMTVQHVNLTTNKSFCIYPLDQIDLEDLIKLHRHNYFELLYFSKVTDYTTHIIDFQPIEVKTNDLILLTPNQVHAFDKKAVSGYAFQFSKDYFIDLLGASHPFSFSIDPFVFQINKQSLAHIKSLIKLVVEEQDNARRDELLRHYLKALFIHISELTFVRTKYANQAEKDIVDSVFQMVDTHFREEKQLAFYSNHLQINQRTINALLVKHTGVTLKQFIYNRTILEAQRMLYTNELLIKEIAYTLGFKDVAHFNKVFLKQMGITPLDFRKQYQGQF